MKFYFSYSSPIKAEDQIFNYGTIRASYTFLLAHFVNIMFCNYNKYYIPPTGTNLKNSYIKKQLFKIFKPRACMLHPFGCKSWRYYIFFCSHGVKLLKAGQKNLKINLWKFENCHILDIQKIRKKSVIEIQKEATYEEHWESLNRKETLNHFKSHAVGR